MNKPQATDWRSTVLSCLDKVIIELSVALELSESRSSPTLVNLSEALSQMRIARKEVLNSGQPVPRVLKGFVEGVLYIGKLAREIHSLFNCFLFPDAEYEYRAYNKIAENRGWLLANAVS